jgi:hypothetical protein
MRHWRKPSLFDLQVASSAADSEPAQLRILPLAEQAPTESKLLSLPRTHSFKAASATKGAS